MFSLFVSRFVITDLPRPEILEEEASDVDADRASIATAKGMLWSAMHIRLEGSERNLIASPVYNPPQCKRQVAIGG